MKAFMRHSQAQDIRTCPNCRREWTYRPIGNYFDFGVFCMECRYRHALVIEDGMKGNTVAALTEEMCTWTHDSIQ